MSSIPLKRCSVCGEEFPATTEYFRANKKGGKYGVHGRCRKCHCAGEREIYRTSEGKTRADKRHKKYRQQPRIKARFRKYYRNLYHRPERKAKVLIYQSTYAKQFPERARLKHALRASRKRQLPSTFTEAEWLNCLEYWRHTCAVCGRQLRDLFGAVIPNADHWIPITAPDCPGTIATNMICLCSSCNRSKSNKSPETWLIETYGKRKGREILKRIQAYFDNLCPSNPSMKRS